jgi:hypothetical protein
MPVSEICEIENDGFALSINDSPILRPAFKVEKVGRVLFEMEIDKYNLIVVVPSVF